MDVGEDTAVPESVLELESELGLGLVFEPVFSGFVGGGDSGEVGTVVVVVPHVVENNVLVGVEVVRTT